MKDYLNHATYYDHVDEDYRDYAGYVKRHKRAVEFANSKPGISPGLRRLLIITLLALVGVLTAYLVG